MLRSGTNANAAAKAGVSWVGAGRSGRFGVSERPEPTNASIPNLTLVQKKGGVPVLAQLPKKQFLPGERLERQARHFARTKARSMRTPNSRELPEDTRDYESRIARALSRLLDEPGILE
jgi:hypothetical protein